MHQIGSLAAPMVFKMHWITWFELNSDKRCKIILKNIRVLYFYRRHQVTLNNGNEFQQFMLMTSYNKERKHCMVIVVVSKLLLVLRNIPECNVNKS